MKMNLNKKVKIALILFIVFSILFAGFYVIQYQVSFSYFNFQKDYSGDVENMNEIIEKVEEFEYNAYLNYSYDPNGYKFVNYISSDILNEYSLKVEENRKIYFLGVPFTQSKGIYSFSVQFISNITYTFNNQNEFPEECLGMSLRSESFENICLDYEVIFPNIFINESYFVGPNENITNEQINNVLFISISFIFTEPSYFSYVSNYVNQIVVLSQDLDVILIMVYRFSRMVT